MAEIQLLASSGTVEGMERCINAIRVETLRADRTGRKCEPYRAGQHDDAEKAGTTPEHAKA